MVESVPSQMGRPKSMFRAMAAPSSSARAVATAAIMAEPKSVREAEGRMCCTAASDRHRPVAMPRCAALCWSTMSISVASVTIHRSE